MCVCTEVNTHIWRHSVRKVTQPVDDDRFRRELGVEVRRMRSVLCISFRMLWFSYSVDVPACTSKVEMKVHVPRPKKPDHFRYGHYESGYHVIACHHGLKMDLSKKGLCRQKSKRLAFQTTWAQSPVKNQIDLQFANTHKIKQLEIAQN